MIATRLGPLDASVFGLRDEHPTRVQPPQGLNHPDSVGLDQRPVDGGVVPVGEASRDSTEHAEGLKHIYQRLFTVDLLGSILPKRRTGSISVEIALKSR